MIFSRLLIAFPTWLTLFGFQIAAALSRRRRSHHIHAASKEKDIISQLSASDKKKEDLISQLPDDILISIIAGVRTKVAVRTSILSNRWRDLYKFVPNIEFQCEHLVGLSVRWPHDSNMVVNGVERFLRLRSGFKIRSLKLRCCLMKLHTDGYEQFIYSIGRLGIERLVLHCSCCLQFSDLSFSCHLLSQMPSLKYFELMYCSLHQMPMPSLKLTEYNSLQVLSLSWVTVFVGALECILSNCLSLHSLSIGACNLPSKLFIRGPNLRLKSLGMASCKGIEEIEFYASNLITFEIKSPEVVNFIFDHVPKLQSVFLDFWNKNTMSCVCTTLVKDLPHLESLIFATKGDIYQVSCRTMGFNTFSNLRQLSLRHYVTNGVNLLSLAPFLQRCPLLQEFHLDTEFLEYDDGREVKRPVAVIQSELKKVEITGHGGTKPEIEFALYILESAICLEQMKISRRPKWYRGCDMWMGRDKPPWSKQTLQMIHKQLRGQALSKNARLTIQHSPIYQYNWRTYDDLFGISVFD